MILTALAMVTTVVVGVGRYHTAATAEQASGAPGISRTWAGSLDVGVFHTCVVMSKVTASNNVRCFGSTGSGVPSSTSTELAIGATASAVSAGDSYSCALLVGGAVRCFGTDTIGQLGGGSMTTDIDLGGVVATQLSANYRTACVVTSTATVRCWGSDDFGQRAGSTTTTDADLPPVAIIRPSWYHSCAILTTGAVRCWGANPNLELGGGSQTTNVPLGGATATAIALGAHHTCVIVTTGSVKCWGRNDDGEVGIPFDGNSPPPTNVPLPAGLTATSIAADRYTTCASMSNGSVYCWGADTNGQLGGPPGDTSPDPSPIPLPAGVFATSVSVSAYHVCATTSTGALVCWGYGLSSALGNANFLPTFVDLSGDTVGPDVAGPTGVALTAAPSTLYAIGDSSTLTATGTDNVGITKVEFYDETSALIGIDTTVADGFTQVATGTTPGAHTFTAKLFDAAGNSTTTTPATVTIASAPDTTIDSGPAEGSTSSSSAASFTFSASPPRGATFECALDGAAFASCTSPGSLAGLANGTHTYQVRASNIGGTDATPATRTWTVSLSVAPTFTASTPATTGTVGVTYPNYTFAATGNPAAMTFTSTGTLPPGLSLTPAGLLSGTPTTAGSFTFTVKAANGIAPDATASVTVVIAAASAAPTFTASTPATTGTVGAPYANYTFAATGNPATMTFSVLSGTLPPGLSLTPAGLLSGTPTTAGSFTFTVTASNGVAPNATVTRTIAVSPATTSVPDLSLRMDADATARTNGWLTYEFEVRNRSAINATGPVVVVDQLPGGMTYVIGGGFGWSCSGAGQTVTCVRPAGLRAQSGSDLWIVVRVVAPVGAVLTNTATVSPADANPSNNTASRVTTVRR